MSASRERKKRLEQPEQTAAAPKKAKKKLSEGWIFTICIFLVLAIVFGSVLVIRARRRKMTVLTVGNHEISVTEFNYFYNSVANSVSNYASYLKLDTSKALDKQYVASEGATYLGLFGIDSDILKDAKETDGTYDITWAQLLASTAKKNAINVYVLYNAAMDAGFQMNDEIQEEIDESVKTMQGYADNNGESLNSLISRVYGGGCNSDNYRDYLRTVHIAEHYADTLSYSDEEIKARYDESPESFTVATYYLYSISGSSFVKADEDGNTPDPTDEDKTKAKEAAEAMEKSFDVKNENVTLKTDNTNTTVTSVVNEDAAKWLFDEAKAEDVKLFEKDGTYYVLKLLSKDDYQTMNGLSLTIQNDKEDTELAEGEKSAAEKVEAIKASLEADSSEANFKALIAEYNGEDQGVLENATRNAMSGISNDALLWSLEERKAGDYRAFETSSGTTFLYFTGYGETYSHVTVNSTLANEWLEKAMADATEVCGYDEDAAMHGNVGIFG